MAVKINIGTSPDRAGSALLRRQFCRGKSPGNASFRTGHRRHKTRNLPKSQPWNSTNFKAIPYKLAVSPYKLAVSPYKLTVSPYKLTVASYK
jgi:hypothetical protein